jgi:hypothetical protein
MRRLWNHLHLLLFSANDLAGLRRAVLVTIAVPDSRKSALVLGDVAGCARPILVVATEATAAIGTGLAPKWVVASIPSATVSLRATRLPALDELALHGTRHVRGRRGPGSAVPSARRVGCGCSDRGCHRGASGTDHAFQQRSPAAALRQAFGQGVERSMIHVELLMQKNTGSTGGPTLPSCFYVARSLAGDCE